MEGNVCDQVVSILIDDGSKYSYISPDLVDKCCLNKELHAKSWLVNLATGTKKRVHHWVRSYAFQLNNMPTSVHLNVLPLGSCSMLFSMDWLYIHRTKIDFYDRGIECLDDDEERRILQGKKKPTSVRIVTNLQETRSCRKGCVLFPCTFPVIKVRMLRMHKY